MSMSVKVSRMMKGMSKRDLDNSFAILSDGDGFYARLSSRNSAVHAGECPCSFEADGRTIEEAVDNLYKLIFA